MASFVALNVEPEEDSEEEIDDTKEIQIEEALKLYQNALKLHSQGPRFFEATQAAYDTLLGSEIFTYPESLSESKRVELYGDSFAEDEDYEINLLPASVVPTGGIDGAPSTLPQVLYLSYKNYGQFLLDRLTHQLNFMQNGAIDSAIFVTSGMRSFAINVVNLFTEALERDDTDIDLWRRTSRISALLGNQRIARFCLESVLDEEAEDVQISPETLGLEAAFAKNELDDLIESINDHLSKSQSQSQLLSTKPQKFPDTLKRLMDTCPELPTPSLRSIVMDTNRNESQCIDIHTPFRTWASLGMSILQHLSNMELAPGGTCLINLPTQEFPATSTFPGTPHVDHPVSVVVNSPTSRTVGESTKRRSSSTGGVARSGNLGTSPVNTTIKDDRETGSALSNAKPNPLETKPDESVDRMVDGAIICNPSLVNEPCQGASFGQANLPTRKRTLESTGLSESIDGGRARSKRIRARVEIPDEDNAAAELAVNYELQLLDRTLADQNVFDLTNRLFTSLECRKMTTLGALRHTLEMSGGIETFRVATEGGLETAIRDFRDALNGWNLDKSSMFLRSDGPEDNLEQLGGDSSGFTLFLEYLQHGSQKPSTQPAMASDEGLWDFVLTINNSYTPIEMVAIRWLIELLAPKRHSSGNENSMQRLSDFSSAYISRGWTDELKEIIVQMLIINDESIFVLLKSQIENFDQRASDREPLHEYFVHDADLLEFIQAIFELYLDVYGRITNPSSQVDQDMRTVQRDRLRRWAGLASQAMRKYSISDIGCNISQVLVLRYVWAVVIHMNITNSASREHVVLCFKDLKTILKDAESPIVEIQNNAVIPEISIQAADREISKLTTIDFFTSIFERDSNNPRTLIESLEPILIDFKSEEGPISRSFSGISIHKQDSKTMEPDAQLERLAAHNTPISSEEQQKQSMMEFLGKASTSLKLFLWRKLTIAYEVIRYPPMIFLCNLRSIDLILQELRSSTYTEEFPDHRAAGFLHWLRKLEDLISRSLTMAIDDPTAFDCIDEHHLRILLQSCADLVKLMHVVALWDDSIRIGQSFVPQQPPGHASTAYNTAITKVRTLHVKMWMLQYTVLREAMAQNVDRFQNPKEDLAEYLKLVHSALGIRQYCKLSNKIFLRFMRTELLSLDASNSWEHAMAQIFFDLYGVRLCPSHQSLEDHGCMPHGLDRSRAIDMIDFVMRQARDINIKDLFKTDLKSAIDKMQTPIGTPRQTGPQTFNKRLITSYLKSPVNPIDLYRCLQGIGSVFSKTVKNEYTSIVSKGWYFILGHMTFAKFRSQKRTSPSPTDDLDISVALFRIDLEFDTEKWETWYRLAQVYDAMIEEDTMWSAEKLNNHKQDLNTLQKNAIHCYEMAVAVAIRCADDRFDTASKISDLYTDFGNRVYASSREPFSMEVFSLTDYSRYFNGEVKGMYQNRPFRDLKLGPAWALSAVLFRQALTDKPRRWMNWYMLGKSLWKMYNYPDETSRNFDYHQVLQALAKAIEFVPERRDSRHPEKDPILEPHYKLVSIVHKLVQRRKISPEDGCRFLKATPYARKVPEVHDTEDWEGHILLVLKSLRSADKSNWHHRMVARAAHVIYDDSSSDVMAAHGAKHELTQQIFTKTMAIQVWKPENERAGRHFVYTGRYVSFFVRLLFQLGDRASLEALAKRIRKKSGDFVDHAKIWQVVCIAYLKLLRIQGSIPEAYEDIIFKSISHETFLLNTSRLETWASTLTDTSDSPILQLLREIIELKKLNNNLMKSTLIDDLVGDTFAHLYQMIVPDLITKSNDEENRDRMRVDHLLMNTDVSAADVPSPAASSQAADQPATRSRPKVVGRREIQRKAEALVMKPTAPPSSGKMTKPPTSAPVAAKQTETPQLSVPSLGAMRDETAVKEGGSSVPGSVHDSADDESELSEPEDVDEEVVPRPMFPGLLGRVGGDEEENVDKEGEGEGEGEGEVDGTEAMDVEYEDEGEGEGQTVEGELEDGEDGKVERGTDKEEE